MLSIVFIASFTDFTVLLNNSNNTMLRAGQAVPGAKIPRHGITLEILALLPLTVLEAIVQHRLVDRVCAGSLIVLAEEVNLWPSDFVPSLDTILVSVDRLGFEHKRKSVIQRFARIYFPSENICQFL